MVRKHEDEEQKEQRNGRMKKIISGNWRGDWSNEPIKDLREFCWNKQTRIIWFALIWFVLREGRFISF